MSLNEGEIEMGMTMTQKILAAHAGLDSVKAGQLIEANLDIVLGNDITSPVAINEFEKCGAKGVFNKERIALVMDHFTPNKDIKAAEQCRQVRNFADKYDIKNYFDVNKNDVIKNLKEWNNKAFDDNDITIIATKDDELVGFYQIKDHDNDNTNFSPWLANVYIVPEKRKMGYSRKLLESIPNILKDLGYDMLYLHTKLINYYDKFGWKKLMPFIKDDGIERNIYISKI